VTWAVGLFARSLGLVLLIVHRGYISICLAAMCDGCSRNWKLAGFLDSVDADTSVGALGGKNACEQRKVDL